jgi:hypothetical protein
VVGGGRGPHPRGPCRGPRRSDPALPGSIAVDGRSSLFDGLPTTSVKLHRAGHLRSRRVATIFPRPCNRWPSSRAGRAPSASSHYKRWTLLQKSSCVSSQSGGSSDTASLQLLVLGLLLRAVGVALALV